MYTLGFVSDGCFLVLHLNTALITLQCFLEQLMCEMYIRVADKWLFLVLHPNKSRYCGNGIACLQATPRAAIGLLFRYRAENLCYQFGHGQKLLPQFRKIVGLVF